MFLTMTKMPGRNALDLFDPKGKRFNPRCTGADRQPPGGSCVDQDISSKYISHEPLDHRY